MASSTVPDPNPRLLDQDNPLYLQSSDHPGMKLISDSFDGTGFSNWKRSMTIALSARNKLGFVDGSIIKPATTDSTFKSWSRCNDMVISWLLGSLSKSIGRSVIYSNSARQMWQELEERYGSPNGTQLFSLHKELSEISQGNSDISDYFTRLKMLWDDIDSLALIPVCSCGCTCGASLKLSNFQQDQRVIQFLMGLNESYTAMRGSILMKTPLPNISQAYSILLQEESQREIHSSTQFVTDSASLHVSSSRMPAYQSSKKPNLDSKRTILNCNYCKKPGHTVDKCYKLHGFPPDFKFTKPRRFAQAAQVEVSTITHANHTQNGSSSEHANINNSPTSTNTHTPGNASVNITPEFYSQLMTLLKNSQNTTETAPSTANFAEIEVAKTATVAELRNSVENVFSHLPEQGPGKVSWSHVWGHFCLCFDGQKLLDDNEYISDYEIRDGDQLLFARHLSINYNMKRSKSAVQFGDFEQPSILNTGELEEEIDDGNYQSCDDKTPRQDDEDDRFPVTTHEYKLPAIFRGWFSYRRVSLSPERNFELKSFSRS
ncbi:uncharacterized protein LOC141697667 [Apium graveolens]|uniref:uncharacterized protein LOC141697667 n=1 Tax=Apium graveolens TaxID=4045 RepID=UPI003D78E31A